jgi:N-acetyl-beta-hexosaminidase
MNSLTSNLYVEGLDYVPQNNRLRITEMVNTLILQLAEEAKTPSEGDNNLRIKNIMEANTRNYQSKPLSRDYKDF